MRAEVRAGAAAAGDHPVVAHGARLGYAASGVLHLLLGWLALRLAWLDIPGEADQGGALQLLAGSTAGSALLWLCALGFGLLAVWQVSEALSRRGRGDRLKSVGRAVVYLALAATTVSVLRGSDGGSEASASARVLASPAGPALLALAGAVVLGIGAYHVAKGLRRTFLRDLREHPGPWTQRAAVAGYVAKGVALGLVGGLFVTGALSGTAEQATGLDGALRALLTLPLGRVLLTLIGVGFAAYGVYAFVRARHARV